MNIKTRESSKAKTNLTNNPSNNNIFKNNTNDNWAEKNSTNRKQNNIPNSRLSGNMNQLNEITNPLINKNARPSTPQTKKVFSSNKSQGNLNKLNTLNEQVFNKPLRKDSQVKEENKRLRRTDFSSNAINKDISNFNYLGNYRTNNPYNNISSTNVNNSIINNSINSNNQNIKKNNLLNNQEGNRNKYNPKKVEYNSNAAFKRKTFTKIQAVIIIQRLFRKFIKVSVLLTFIFM